MTILKIHNITKNKIEYKIMPKNIKKFIKNDILNKQNDVIIYYYFDEIYISYDNEIIRTIKGVDYILKLIINKVNNKDNNINKIMENIEILFKKAGKTLSNEKKKEYYKKLNELNENNNINKFFYEIKNKYIDKIKNGSKIINLYNKNQHGGFVPSFIIDYFLTSVLDNWANELYDVLLTVISIAVGIGASIPGLQAVYGIGLILDIINFVILILETKTHYIYGEYDENNKYHTRVKFSFGNLIMSIFDWIAFVISLIPVAEIIGGIGKSGIKIFKLFNKLIKSLFKSAKKVKKIGKIVDKLTPATKLAIKYSDDVLKKATKLKKILDRIGLSDLAKNTLEELIISTSEEIAIEIKNILLEMVEKDPEYFDKRAIEQRQDKKKIRKKLTIKYTEQITNSMIGKFGGVLLDNKDVFSKSISRTIENIIKKLIDKIMDELMQEMMKQIVTKTSTEKMNDKEKILIENKKPNKKMTEDKKKIIINIIEKEIENELSDIIEKKSKEEIDKLVREAFIKKKDEIKKKIRLIKNID